MKKILLAAVAALAIVGCSQNEEIEKAGEKAEKELNWKRKVDFKGLVAMMMDADMQAVVGVGCEEFKNRK